MTKHMGRITDDALARLRDRLGQEMSIAEPPYLTEVTRDAVRHWAWATGDRNPLFLDEAYARSSRHGGLVAPPTILYAFDRLSIGYRGGLPGVHSMFGGSHWRWHRLPRLGDIIHAEVTFKDLVELPSRFAGRMFRQISHIRFVTAEGEEIAELENRGGCAPSAARPQRRANTRLSSLSPTRKSSLMRSLHATRRNTAAATPLFATRMWKLATPCRRSCAVHTRQRPPLPLNRPGWPVHFGPTGYWFDFLKRHPAAGINNSLGIPEPPEAVHWDTELARSVRVPRAYDYGPERIAWLSTMLVNWIGDAGDLKEFYCEIRRFNMIGDLTIGHVRIDSKARAGGWPWIGEARCLGNRPKGANDGKRMGGCRPAKALTVLV